jgi:succinoglycan biosynthesis protein ExoW
MIAQADGGTAVIIPYFQRKPGLLTAAIRSALAQEAAGPITVVVCDDGSPIPAELDLAMLAPSDRDRVLLIRQANGGAGPARNAALDAIPYGIEWIAFLDSDDSWEPGHIARALAALREGNDFCFADALRAPQTQTHFQGAGFDPGRHKPLDAAPGLFEFTGNFLTLNIAMSPVSISTVVMRASALKDQRFPDMAVEDLMLWFQLAKSPIRVAFDATLQVHYGHGDITLADGWTSRHALRMCLSYHRVFMRIAREFDLTAEQRGVLSARMADNRRNFCTATLARLFHRQAPAWRVGLSFWRLDPQLLPSLLQTASVEVRRRLPFGQRAPAA